jgi:hypothetical protein
MSSECFTIQEDCSVMMTCPNWLNVSHAVQRPITLTISARGIYLHLASRPEHYTQGTRTYCLRYNDKIIKHGLDYKVTVITYLKLEFLTRSGDQ